MGYALVAVIVAGVDGGAAVLVYLVAYTLMNMGAFAAIAMLSEREDRPHLIADLRGQGFKRPIVALALTVCLFSLAGVPPFRRGSRPSSWSSVPPSTRASFGSR